VEKFGELLVLGMFIAEHSLSILTPPIIQSISTAQMSMLLVNGSIPYLGATVNEYSISI
jgi:hypothetical protein